MLNRSVRRIWLPQNFVRNFFLLNLFVGTWLPVDIEGVCAPCCGIKKGMRNSTTVLYQNVLVVARPFCRPNFVAKLCSN